MKFFRLSVIIALTMSPCSHAIAHEDYKHCELEGLSTDHGGTASNGQTCDDGKWRGEALPPGGIPLGFGNNPCDDPKFQCDEK